MTSLELVAAELAAAKREHPHFCDTLLAQLEREIRYGAAWNRRAGEDEE